MKCVELKSGEIVRVADYAARALVATPSMGTFCPKDKWKRQEKIGPYAPQGGKPCPKK